MAGVVSAYDEGDYVEEGYSADYDMDIIEEANLLTKLIRLKPGTTAYHPVDDIYREMRFIRAHDISLRVMDNPVEARGNIAKGGGKFTSRLAIYNDGWLVKPADESHVLKVTGEQISDIGTSGVALMQMAQFSPGVNVSVEYAPPDTEIVVITTGSAVTPQDLIDISQAVWDYATSSATTVGSMGEFVVKKLLTFVQFLGQK